MEAKRKILVVDDDPYILKLLTQLLEDLEDCEIHAVNSAAAALSILETEDIHILITDQMMPLITGTDLLTRAAKDYPDTCRIMITANTDLNVAMEAINKGKVFAYLNKPIDETQLFAVLEKAKQSLADQQNRKTMMLEMEKIISDSRIDRYQIIQKIGEGGMGNIYKAWCEEENRFVALKVLKDKAHTPLDKERFMREILACEMVDHPGIVKIYAKGECNCRLYIAEELLEGESLSEWLMKRDRIDIGDSARIALGTIRILRAIHDNRIIHRDLKPSNLFVVSGKDPMEKRIKILDFGIARFSDLPRITQSGVLEGTAEYIAPESMVRYHAATPAVDLYAYGIILYYLFYQVSPYENLSIRDIIQHKIDGEIRVPDSSSVPPEIGGMIDRLTKRQADARLLDYNLIGSILTRYIG